MKLPGWLVVVLAVVAQFVLTGAAGWYASSIMPVAHQAEALGWTPSVVACPTPIADGGIPGDGGGVPITAWARYRNACSVKCCLRVGSPPTACPGQGAPFAADQPEEVVSATTGTVYGVAAGATAGECDLNPATLKPTLPP